MTGLDRPLVGVSDAVVDDALVVCGDKVGRGAEAGNVVGLAGITVGSQTGDLGLGDLCDHASLAASR